MRSARELQAEAWQAIVKALGPADALRYQALFEPGRGDYAREREELFGELSLDEWIAYIRERGRSAPK